MTTKARCRWLGVLALTMLAVAPAAAQTGAAKLGGDWTLSYSTPRGENTMTLHFTQQNDSLGGTAELRRGSGALAGTVKGDSVTFTMTMQREERTFTLKFAGQVQGDSARGTMETPRGASPWTAVRGAPGQ